MRNGSSDFVKITYLDKNLVMETLRSAVSALFAQHANVKTVRLFGSLTRSDYAPGSDADVMIVLARDERRMMDRIPEFSAYFSNVPVDVDCFPITEAELNRKLKERNTFWTKAMQESIPLISDTTG